MFPAVSQNIFTIALITITFSIATIGSMLIIVTSTLYGLKFINFRRGEKYSHAIAGLLILICGLSIKFLGL
jgi:hypothetical protein